MSDTNATPAPCGGRCRGERPAQPEPHEERPGRCWWCAQGEKAREAREAEREAARQIGLDLD